MLQYRMMVRSQTVTPKERVGDTPSPLYKGSLQHTKALPQDSETIGRNEFPLLLSFCKIDNVSVKNADALSSYGHT